MYQTEQFRFSDNELHLLRSRFPLKKIEFDRISKITIGKGIRVKNPILVLSFGLIVTFTSLYILFFSAGLVDSVFDYDLDRSLIAAKAIGYLIIMIGFMLAIGGIAIYQAVFPTWIMRTDLDDGSYHVFSLRKLFHTNEVFKLTRLLKEKFSQSKLDLDNRLA